jgi:type IV pilus assembly protein PilA
MAATYLPNACTVAKTKFVASGAADSEGKITIVGDGTNLSQINGAPNLTLVPMVSGLALSSAADGGKTIEGWRCGLLADGTSIATKYLPSSCRGTYP